MTNHQSEMLLKSIKVFVEKSESKEDVLEVITRIQENGKNVVNSIKRKPGAGGKASPPSHYPL